MERISYQYESQLMQTHFTEDEVLAACKRLKNNKAPGWDNVCAEHVKYGGRELLRVLSYIYNKITQEESIPLTMKKGVIIPIPKGTKDQTVMDNKRGITHIPTMGKVYEKLLLARHEQSVSKN